VLRARCCLVCVAWHGVCVPREAGAEGKVLSCARVAWRGLCVCLPREAGAEGKVLCCVHLHVVALETPQHC
jgi:hypothetical protein